MRYFRLAAAAASVFAMAACGGGGDNQASNNDVNTSAESASADMATSGAVAFAPITGETHVVEMLIENGNYIYKPSEITVKEGDGIKYVNISGGPHDVSFDPAALPADVRPQLAANMPNSVAELRSPMMIQPNEEYTVSFGKVKPGTYTVICTPHAAMNMTQKVTVTE